MIAWIVVLKTLTGCAVVVNEKLKVNENHAPASPMGVGMSYKTLERAGEIVAK